MNTDMVELWVIVGLVVIIMIIRFKGFKLLEPIIKEIEKTKPLFEGKEVIEGISLLQISVGLCLILILLLTYQRYFDVRNIWLSSASVLTLVLIGFLSYKVYYHFKRSSRLIEHIAQERKIKFKMFNKRK